jgi:stage IV sporulation protein A
MGETENISLSRVLSIDLGRGVASAELQLPRELFYQTLSTQSGFQVSDDGDLMELLTELAGVKASYDKVSSALSNVYETGYGIVMPTMEELQLEEPEVMRQGGRYGIKLKATAPRSTCSRWTSSPPCPPS